MGRARIPDTDSGQDLRQQKLDLAWHEPAPGDAPAQDPATLGEPQSPASPADRADPTDRPDPTDPGDGAAAADPPPEAAAAEGAPSPVAAAAPSPAPVTAGLARPRDEGASGPVAGAAVEMIGEMLIGARIASGLQPEEVATRTRIPRAIIAQLESNAFDELPSDFHCNNYVSKLCELYNIPSGPLCARLREDLLAHRGAKAGGQPLKVVSTDTGGGPVISYVPAGPVVPRALSEPLIKGVVSGVIVLFLLIALAALAVQHFHHRDGQTPAGPLPAPVGHSPPVDLQEFMTPRQLNAYELPIPDK